MNIELDRITHPLRLARGSHQPGSGKGCAMNVISYINGDVEVTDFPACSARPLARMIQELNDGLADEDGYLSPKNSVLVLNLGWRTVGTADVPREVVLRWLAELLVNPVHGVIQHANPAAVPAIRHVAELLKREMAGDIVSTDEWVQAHTAADAVDFVAKHCVAYALSCAVFYATCAAYAAIASASHPYPYIRPQPEFTLWAIEKWRELAKLDEPQPITAVEINNALKQIGSHA